MKINNFRWKKINKEYLLTNDSGHMIFLNENGHNELKKGKIPLDFKKELYEKKFLLDKKNIEKYVSDVRNINWFFFEGTSLHIVIPTLQCNLNCLYCHASSKSPKKKKYLMQKSVARDTVDFILQTPAKGITIEFQGGEPLLNWEIVKYIVEYVNEKNKKIRKQINFTIVTNLSLMNEKIMKYLADKKISVCTSLDGPKNVHDRNRKFIGGAGSYDSTVNWIKKLKAKKIRINALTTITKFSLDYPEEIVDEYVRNGFQDIALRPLNNLGHAIGKEQEIDYSAEEFIRFWKKCMDHIIKLNREEIMMRERMVEVMIKKMLRIYDSDFLDLRSPCGAVIGQMAYMHDGSIYSCDEGRMLGKDVFKIGNVKQKFSDVVTSQQGCSIVAASINDTLICDACVFKPYCGVCPVCNYAEQGNMLGKIPETKRCKIYKAQFEYILEKKLHENPKKAGIL